MLVIGLLGSATLPQTTEAEVLATALVSDSWSSSFDHPHRARARFHYLGDTGVIFDDVWLVSSDIGTTLVADASSDTNFAEIVRAMTDGDADLPCVGTELDAGIKDVCFFEDDLFGLSSADFRGSRIDSITLRVDNLSFVDVQQGDGVSIAWTFTVQVHGEEGAVQTLSSTWGQLKAGYR